MSARHTLLTLALLACLPGAAGAQTSYGFRVLESKPQSRQHFVQGLQIVDGELYLSTGGYGESRLLRYRFDDGALDTARQLHPRLFGEGLTVVDDRIYQLTWRAGLVIVWDRDSLRPLETLRIATQGWGITYNGEQLIYSDGSERLYFMDRSSGKVTRALRVTDGGEPVPRLNELEWIDGKVWANVWQSDEIVIIDPDNGHVTARLDLAGLLPDSERTAGTDVLNGIAQNPADGAIWVTGKRWPHMYRIELVPRGDPGPT